MHTLTEEQIQIIHACCIDTDAFVRVLHVLAEAQHRSAESPSANSWRAASTASFREHLDLIQTLSTALLASGVTPEQHALIEHMQAELRPLRSMLQADENVPPVSRKLRILVAEDNPIYQQLLHLMLTRHGYQARIVDNGPAVLAAIQSAQADQPDHGPPFDVILMDVEMPGDNGIDVTRRIRAEWPSVQQPYIIAITSHTQADALQQYAHAGFDGSLNKTTQLEYLPSVLAHYLPHHASGAHHPQDAPSALAHQPPATPGVAAPVPAADDPDSPIDPIALQQLAQRLGDDSQQRLHELISIFLDHTKDFAATLEEASTQHDYATLRYIAHTLKSSSATLGALHLSEQCRRLEQAVRAQDIDQIAPLTAALISALHEARAALVRHQYEPGQYLHEQYP